MRGVLPRPRAPPSGLCTQDARRSELFSLIPHAARPAPRGDNRAAGAESCRLGRKLPKNYARGFHGPVTHELSRSPSGTRRSPWSTVTLSYGLFHNTHTHACTRAHTRANRFTGACVMCMFFCMSACNATVLGCTSECVFECCCISVYYCAGVY